MQVENIDRVPPEASATCNVSWCTRLCEYRCSASRTRTVYLDHSSLQFCRMKSRGRKFFELIQRLERALKIDRLVAISSGGWYSCALRWWLDSHFYRTMRFFTWTGTILDSILDERGDNKEDSRNTREDVKTCNRVPISCDFLRKNFLDRFASIYFILAHLQLKN